MKKYHYNNIENADGMDLFPVEDFRLIPEEAREVPCGISEIPVKVDMHKKFAKSLSFKTSWDFELYGFVKCKKILFSKTGCDDTVSIHISDWDDKFIVIFENKDGDEKPVYSVKNDYVKNLLDKCIKPERLD